MTHVIVQTMLLSWTLPPSSTGTSRHAAGAGFQSEVLRYHAASGRFIRVRRGLYRLRDYPSSPYDEIAAAWLAVGKEKSVISHETALDLLDLSNVIPNAIHITVPRSRRVSPRSRVYGSIPPPVRSAAPT